MIAAIYRHERREQVLAARAPNWVGWFNDHDKGAAHRALRIARQRQADAAAQQAKVDALQAEWQAAYAADSRRYAPQAEVARRLDGARKTLRTLQRGADSIWKHTPRAWAGTDGGNTAFFEDPPFRYVGASHEISRYVDHKGWWLDPDGDGESVHGVVYQLPARRGRVRLLAGYADPWNDGAALLSLDIIESDDFDDAKNEAARIADGMAETMAEREREYQQAYRDGTEARETMRALREQGRALVDLARELRDAFRSRHSAAREHDALRAMSLWCFGLDAAALAAAAWRRHVNDCDEVAELVGKVRDAREEYRDARHDAHRALIDAAPSRRDTVNHAAFWEGYNNGL